MKYRIISRKSDLALVQTRWVISQLSQQDSQFETEIVSIDTKGDLDLSQSLSKIGGKGLFVQELQDQLLLGKADFAVHSLKDMPARPHSELALVFIGERASPLDAFVSNSGTLDELPMGAVVGTSSLRRQVQIQSLRPDIKIKSLRGNVPSRLRKLASGEYHGIVLAKAGLERLGLADQISQTFEINELCPAVGQGALVIECKASNQSLLQRLESLVNPMTSACLVAERRFNLALGGSCQIPIAAHAQLKKGNIKLIGMVADLSGNTILESDIASMEHAEELGQRVADKVIARGGLELIKDLIQ